MTNQALISAGWLSEALESKKASSLRVLDCTWYAPGGKDAKKEFSDGHIPGAFFFDLEECKDKASPYEMMLPNQSQFSEYVGSLGINNQSHVVVYDCDNTGMYYSPRVWWMFRVFGHNNVSILEGGLLNWVKSNLPVTSEITPVSPEKFNVTLNSPPLKTFEEVQENLSSKKFQLVDARSQQRFQGPEPKPGEVEPGHIPGSVNLPFSSFLTNEGFERPAHEMRRLFEEKGIDLKKPMIATCRRGVTACHLALASFILGKEDTAVYDGSWYEWFHRAKAEDKVFESRK